MITRRKGNGQTECYGCKQKGKQALTWDSFLYTYDNKPYCFDCLMEQLDNLTIENKFLKFELSNLFDIFLNFIRRDK